MLESEILRRALEKATSNGFKLITHKHFCEVGRSEIGIPVSLGGYESIIFDHNFAIAFWGEESILEEYPLSDGSEDYLKIWMPAWQAHLRKMVLEIEPLKYLEKFLITSEGDQNAN